MQRIVALIFISLIAFSCSNEIEFRTPALQGAKNYDSWTAKNFQATMTDNGGVKIIGVNNSETITLYISSFNSGTYNLESSTFNTATFSDNNFKTYSTKNNGDGEIVIEDYDSVNLTITGTFRFNSYSINGELINFINGVFYKIPIASVSTEILESNLFNATVDSNNIEVNVVETVTIDNVLQVRGNYIDGTFIEFFIPENIQIGSYTLNSSTQIYANYVLSDGSIAASQYGTLTILEHDTQFKKIKASFLFNTGYPHNISVSNGNFVVYY